MMLATAGNNTATFRSVTTTLTVNDTEIEPDELTGNPDLNTLLATVSTSDESLSYDTFMAEFSLSASLNVMSKSTMTEAENMISAASTLNDNVTTTTASVNLTPRSPFYLKHTELDEFVQFGPDGTLILAPTGRSGSTAFPASFTLPLHGYLTSEDSSEDMMFLRPVNPTSFKTRRQTRSSNLPYYDVRYGPKDMVTVGDLAYRFKLDSNSLGFEYDGVTYQWYAESSSDSTSKLYMAPSGASVPDTFRQIQLSSPAASSTNLLANSSIPAIPSRSLNQDLDHAESTLEKSTSSSIVPVSTKITINTDNTEGCLDDPDVTHVWQVVNSIAEYALQGFCSTLLSYIPTTTTETFADLTEVLETTVTIVNSTETERTLSFTATNSIIAATEYIATGGYAVRAKRRDTTVFSTIELPSELTSFCAVDIIEACSQAISPSGLTAIFSTPITVTSISSALTAITNTTTTTLAAASTTILANTTAISYPGTGLITPDSGTYRLWYLYWPDYPSTPALFLRSTSTGAAYFTAEFRPNINAYRLYATPYVDGEKYYLSIIAGIPEIDDYNVGLRTLNDIDSDERSVMLYVYYELSSRYISVNSVLTGTDRDTMYGCPVTVAGKMLSQVRLYRGDDGSAPADCQPWSNLMFAA
ncbi:hypothetical protein Dda_1664 [Drechslerella dactyloides]|uniref:Uncharacterized protein n=1 Tax=Drechslerella dactyloides TaxID=74499 RepID=A0AAD6J2F4_DREDA|nr:hypothetical protein Dda_1664 [Drechslerella dactyloides]